MFIVSKRFPLLFEIVDRDGALRYRTLPTSLNAIPTERFAIALSKPQNSDTFGALSLRVP
ncbi:MAG: hypothetical protein ACKPFD_02850 [Dolichospermum sp.]